MSITKTYSCGICKTTPDQISHHKSHIKTQKHQDKKDLFQFKLLRLNNDELQDQYKTLNISDIVKETETILYKPLNDENDDLIKKKLSLQPNFIFIFCL